MPAFHWSKPPGIITQDFEQRHPGSGASVSVSPLVMWACWAVEGLHYLGDIDRAHTGTRAQVFGHHPDIVDIANVRWATGTAITALDLCAAALGNAFCGNVGSHEMDLRDFESGKIRNRPKLPAPALRWVDAVLNDARYVETHDARNPFTHSWLNRILKVGGPSGAAGRTDFVIRSSKRQTNARHLVEMARDLATDQTVAFLNVFDGL